MWLFLLGGIICGVSAGLLRAHFLAVAVGALSLAAIQTWYIWRGAERAKAIAETLGREIAPQRERLLYLTYTAGIFVVMAMGIVFATYGVVRWTHG